MADPKGPGIKTAAAPGVKTADEPEVRDVPVADTTEKAFNMALQFSDLSGRLMSTLRTAVSLAEAGQSSGINFSGADYSGTQLKHCTGDDIQTSVSNFVALLDYLKTNFIDDVFDKIAK